MPVTGYDSGDLFIFRITKHLTTNPDNTWANTYEFEAQDVGAEAGLLALGEILVDFEAAFHLTAVVFDRILISTWQPDSKPYNPSTFISSSLTANGLSVFGEDMLPLDKALSVSRQATSGRFGHLFYRGVLQEADTNAPAGRSVLVNRALWQTKIDDAVTSSGLSDHIGGTPTDFALVMVGKTSSEVRRVLNLRAQGVGSVPTDHAWFNRTTTP